MSVTTRAKFRCVNEIRSAGFGAVTYKFMAMADSGIPEDQRYHKYTPAGTLEITVDNPAVQFELGASYYLDFTEAEAE